MIFNGFQRDDDDSVFTIVRNVSGATRAAGTPMVWDVSASVDGVRVSTPATATLSVFRGILADSLNDSAYGRCQIHGYNTYAAVWNGVTTMAPGDILKPAYNTTAQGLTWSAVADGTTGFVYIAQTVAYVTQTTLSTTAACKVLIRAL